MQRRHVLSNDRIPRYRVVDHLFAFKLADVFDKDGVHEQEWVHKPVAGDQLASSPTLP